MIKTSNTVTNLRPKQIVVDNLEQNFERYKFLREVFRGGSTHAVRFNSKEDKVND